MLVIFQYLGELCANLGVVNLPGPLLGMLMLLVVLTLYGKSIEFLDQASNLLIQNLSLMFIPPSVGAFFLGSQIYQQFPLLLATILLSTLLAILFMALLIKKLPNAPSDNA
ncbi:MAG: CidA/LrgA family protein [Porticoccaceae bacterium]|nr:CidA/LrgA family protein [Porticoccaceae bacterium]MBT5577927.1 CidA/LrgA family protein [Porticoccaceae bacterium]MBT7376117.1 CidA/LrgA family protein [Porticoccaceae bacterium]